MPYNVRHSALSGSAIEAAVAPFLVERVLAFDHWLVLAAMMNDGDAAKVFVQEVVMRLWVGCR